MTQAASLSVLGASRTDDHGLASTRPVAWVASMVWAVPVVLSVLSPGHPAAATLTLIIGAVCAALVIFEPRIALVMLPFYALLSPLGGFLPLPGARLLLSDLIFPILAVQAAVLVLHRRMRLTTGLSFAALMGATYLLSLVGGLVLGTLVSMKPVLFIMQFWLILLYTREYARVPADWSVLIQTWIAAIVLGSLLLARAFLAGTPLAGFEYGMDAPAPSQNILLLFRATYYYAGFHFLLGIAIVVVLLRLLFPAPLRQRILLLPVLAILSTALLMMLAKTAIVSLFVTIAIVLAVMLPLRPRETTKASFILAAWLLAILVLITAAFFAVLGDVQAEAWTQRVFSEGSFIARVEVYAQALTSWLDRPFSVIAGLGPDFLGDSGSPELSHSFMRSAATGVQEGAVDSGWITYLLEMGLLGLGALIGAYYAALRNVHRVLIHLEGEAVFGPTLWTFASLVFIAVALATQMLGYSKTAWFPFQLLSIGLMQAMSVTRSAAPAASTQN